MCKRINLISGPRNISTALMYSFANRSDTSVVDEPMYAYYLKSSGKSHPGKEEILNSLPVSIEDILESIIYKPIVTPYYFIKSMAQHYYQVDLNFLLDLDNVFLIRDPKQLIASFARVIPNPTLQDIGLKREYELYQFLFNRGSKPVVIDSGEMLRNPEKSLRILCSRLSIPFSSNMLKWPPGPKEEDGIWAKYWYSNVHKSTGFVNRTVRSDQFPVKLTGLLEEAKKYYSFLYDLAIKV